MKPLLTNGFRKTSSRRPHSWLADHMEQKGRRLEQSAHAANDYLVNSDRRKAERQAFLFLGLLISAVMIYIYLRS